MKKQYISPSFFEVKLQGVGMIAISTAHMDDNGNGQFSNFEGDDDAWEDAGVKGFTSDDLWNDEW